MRKTTTDEDIDIVERYEEITIEMGRPYSRRYGWTPREADPVVKEMLGKIVETVEELAELVEAEDWDAIVALAQQERTRRMIRGAR